MGMSPFLVYVRGVKGLFFLRIAIVTFPVGGPVAYWRHHKTIWPIYSMASDQRGLGQSQSQGDSQKGFDSLGLASK
ncbi:MAG: hypothetical protein CR994_09155 [Maribacter sp.]|nr:MAG: hypothetical protein CR994_09155 [Maribacter sp.]